MHVCTGITVDDCHVCTGITVDDCHVCTGITVDDCARVFVILNDMILCIFYETL